MQRHWATGTLAAALTIALAGCVSTVSFRASPGADASSASLACTKSTSGVCTFQVWGSGAAPTRTYTVAVGEAVPVSLPAGGADVQGCVANKAFPACHTVHVLPGTTVNAESDGW